MPETYRVRPATASDIAAISALLCALHREEGYESHATEHAAHAALFGADREVKLQAHVALGTADEVIGLVLYYPGYDTLSASEGYHLADIVVAKKHRRAGVGKLLMKALGTHAQTNKKTWISLTVLKQNQAARGFYQSLGMTNVAVDFFAVGQVGISQL